MNWEEFAPRRPSDAELHADHAHLAASVQRRIEEVLLDLCNWLHRETGAENLTLAGGIALNCVANTYLHRDGPFRHIWVQPASGDSGTALGVALSIAVEGGDTPQAMTSAALGRGFEDPTIETALRHAKIRYERCDDVAATVAQALAEDKIVAWFQGRSEFGPRALGNRSLLAHPGRAANLDRLNDVKGREQFRPVAPMVLADRAAEVFSRGPIPSPYMLFVGSSLF